MAAIMARNVPGLMRPLTLFARGQQICRFSTIINRQTVQRSLVTTPAWASLSAKGFQTPKQSILQRVAPLIPSLVQQPSRNLTYISVKKGKRKSVKSVVKRFMRLHCGLWIRRKAGYKKKLWKKLPARKKRLREHVFCNKTQNKLLDKMTTKFWKRRNWFVNDPYKKYHERVNLKV
ncbi:39S ribosomal protein L35, mitochondrial [Oncorhynchus mykiss]|uniref:Large ribosomal subunit protein bL35m n=2 Tax=Oncorhynchus TaxID=8016 RepID=C1BEW2_ONCMY|nr:39S ribosomal protein L35, mitochondrial [Oncorhynchus kisutch]XP_021429963.2 39S ribosomal protein L35, mitochondrial [Oncorhynchus mykiss]XP_035598872.1 39S ribosomal protein L35, mitochondrial [Oncorhynchus keta]ACO07565.1 39S ribosomal protein L35, mitochondrial precursor [Oncorhynchus mykiss]